VNDTGTSCGGPRNAPAPAKASYAERLESRPDGTVHETLHANPWLSLKVMRKPDVGVNGYVYSHETRCQGRIVAILPYRDSGGTREYLVKSEMTPCWGLDQVLSAITGGYEGGDECLAGDTPITRADTGARIPIRDLVGQQDIPVWTLDEHLQLRSSAMSEVWSTGVKPVCRLRLSSGRELTLTVNHPLLTVHGWSPVGLFKPGDHVAVARWVPQHTVQVPVDCHRIVLAAHLIGDGCTLPRRCLVYTTADPENVRVVIEAADAAFGIKATSEPKHAGRVTEVRLSDPRANRGRPNLLRAWLERIGLHGCRAWDKFIPEFVFELPAAQAREFIRHLWATDGSVTTHHVRGPRIYYSTTSRRLADDVQALLLRAGIGSRLRALPTTTHRQGWSVDVSGAANQWRFLAEIGVHGARSAKCDEALRALENVRANPNVGCMPSETWDYVRKVMRSGGVTYRQLAAALGMSDCGTALFRDGISRDRMSRVAAAVPDPYLSELASSDVDWDRVVSIEAAGTQEVFDAHVPTTHSFLANDVISHNSGKGDAVREMLEETGYTITRDELIPLGESLASKSADTVYSLFTVDLTGREQGEATGDETRLQAESAAVWLKAHALASLKDPQVAVMYVRMAAMHGAQSRAGGPAPEREPGEFLREVWVEWAGEQPDPKPSWLVPWKDLDPRQREVDARMETAIRADDQRRILGRAGTGDLP
jgi:intein/homing endonuclease